MNNQSTDTDETDKQPSKANRRPFRSELLTKIYYPDTLYPDNYTFFADRRSQSMDTNDPTETSINTTATIPKPTTTETEMNEQQNKSPVSFIFVNSIRHNQIKEHYLEEPTISPLTYG